MDRTPLQFLTKPPPPEVVIKQDSPQIAQDKERAAAILLAIKLLIK